MSVLRFKCKCCNSYHDIDKTTPTGFLGWCYPDMEWSDFTDEVSPLSQERWRITKEVTKLGSNVIPNNDEIRTVRVKLPFEEEVGSEFYMEYLPISAYLDGFEIADQFERSAILKCRFVEIIAADDYNAWIKVQVLDVIMFSQLASIFPPYKADSSLEGFSGSGSCDDIDADEMPWQCKSWSADGDITETKIFYTDEIGTRHLVWMTHEDFFNHISYFGNII